MENTQQPTSPTLLSPLGRTSPSCRTTLLSLTLLLAIAFLATLPGYLSNRVYVPTDILYQYAPWRDPANPDFRPGNPALLDQATQFVPWMIFAVDQLKRGEIPLWNPHQQLGAPFLANGQSAIFYPTILLHLFLPPTWSWTLAATLKLFLAGVGAYYLARHYRLSTPASLLAGISFMLCGFNVVWLNHPHTNVMALLPLAILSLLRLLDKPSLLRIAAASVILALQFLGGHPASCIHLLFTAGLVYLLHLIWLNPRPTLRATPATLLAVFLGFSLAAVQWLPLLDYATHSGAAAARQNILDQQPWIQFNPKYLLGILFPYANGYPADRISPYQISLATRLPNPNELAPGWAGTIPLLLAILALLLPNSAPDTTNALPSAHRAGSFPGRNTIRLWLILALIAAAIAIRFPIIDQLIRHLPGLKLSQNARLLVVVALAISILAAHGLDLLLAHLKPAPSLSATPPRLRKPLLVTSLALVLLSLSSATLLFLAKDRILSRGHAAVAVHYTDDPADSHEYPQEYWNQVVHRIHTELVLTALRLLIPASFLFSFALLLPRSPLPIGGGDTLVCRGHSCPHLPFVASSLRRFVAVPLLALSTLDLLLFAVPYNPGAPASTYYPAESSLTFLQTQSTPNDRLAATHHSLHPESATGYRLRDIRGYDAVTPHRYYHWLHATSIVGSHMLPESIVLDDVNHPALRLLSLRYLLTAVDQPSPGPTWRPLQSFPHANLYELASPLPRARIVPHAQWHTSPDTLLPRVAAMDFDPQQLVLLEGRRPPTPMDNWQLAVGNSQSTPTQDTHPRIEYLEDTPQRVRLSISDSAAGWLVLADTYDPDWKVTLRQNATSQPGTLLPAYGILRAVPIPDCRNETLEVLFEYQPRSWRYGLMATAAAMVLLIVLLGFGLVCPKRETTTGL